MANQEHLDLFKRGIERGIEAWNKWQKVPIGLPFRLDLRGADLMGTDLISADLSHIDLSGANLSGANLNSAVLVGTFLVGTNLSSTDLRNANFSFANLRKANLTSATLSNATFEGADLTSATLISATLNRADLSGAFLSGANLTDFKIGFTNFGDYDLREVKGLETITHEGPSPLSINTIYLSGGEIPEAFVRGTGAPDTFIDYMHSLVGKTIEYYSCFISYSSKDDAFARRLYADLQSKGVRCWFAPEDMKTGDEIRTRIDEAIRIHDKLLLVLSVHSVDSTWVKKEVETAFEKEDRQKRLVLFPVRLDDTVMQTTKAWAADIRRMRHITDFTRWKEHDTYQKAFARLLRNLKAETQKTEEP